MNRREMLKRILGVGGAVFALPATARLTRTYPSLGLMTPNEVHARENVMTAGDYIDADEVRRRGWFPANAYLDGVDVSKDCRAVCIYPDGRGWADIMKRNGLGQHYVENGRLATERRWGRVLVVPNVEA